MATFGLIQEFQPDNERISAYLERVQMFFQANDIAEEKQVPILLSVIGGKTYALLSDLLAPVKPSTKSFKDLQEVLQRHFEPKPVVIAERFRFHQRNQTSGESIADYVAELRRLATHCKFGDYLSEALRDRLVCGIHSESTQRRLLAEADLTLARAIEVAQSMEAAEINAQQLKGSTLQVGQMAASLGDRSACYRCGSESHRERDCRFKEAVCYNCGKIGHLAKVCRAPQQSSGRQPRSRGRGGRRTTRWVGATEPCEEDPSNSDLPILTVGGRSTQPITAVLELNGRSVPMEVDTGAAVSLIAETTQRRLFPEGVLEKSKVRLNTYTAEPLPVVGVMRVEVRYGGYTGTHDLYVVTGDGPTLLGRDWLKRVRLDWKSLGVAYVREKPPGLQPLLQKYTAVFTEELGTMKEFSAKLAVRPGAKPRFHRPRSVPYALKEAVEQELDRMERLGVIEKVSHSNWAAPVVAVPKRDGTIRLCGDYKVTVNHELEVDQYPLPQPEDLMACLTGGQKFSKLDLSAAYQQMPLDDESRHLTTINTHRGLYQFARLPFGIASAPAVFQKAMDVILQGIPHTICYLDDILVTGVTDEDHLRNLGEVLDRLQRHGICLKQGKCAFMQASVEYLGHLVDAQGIHVTSGKVEAVRQAPSPSNVTELKSFLGLLNYYGKFIPHLSTLLHPLNALLKEGQTWNWSQECEAVFQEAKRQLSSAPVLVHYDPSLPIRLAGDASSYGIGAVLSHVLPDGSEHPIAYASRTLQPAEKNYAQVEKEALSLVFGIQKFHKYVYGRLFTLVTDHKPLTTILGPKTGVPPLAAARMQRWALLLSAYNYHIEFRPTNAHANADGMSRLPLPQTPLATRPSGDSEFNIAQIQMLPVSFSQVQKANRTDPVLGQVQLFLKKGWPKRVPEPLQPFWHRRWELTEEGGCVLWGFRVVVPSKLQQKVLGMLHETHMGIVRMKSIARSYVWWPGIDRDIETMVKACEECQAVKSAPAKTPLHPWVWPPKPWQRIHIDYAGPFRGRMFLLIVDAHSKWPEVREVGSTTSAKTIEVLRQLFSVFGLPEQLVSDNGPQFASDDFAVFLRQNGVKHLRTAPYHPASNGAAERLVQTFKQAMRAAAGNGLTLQHQLSNFLMTYRSTPHATTGETPSKLFLGRQIRTRFDLLRPDLEGHVGGQQAAQKQHHDAHARERSLEIGTSVMAKDFRDPLVWKPGVVLEKCGPLSYLVKLRNGQVWRRHIDHLRELVEGFPPVAGDAPPREPPGTVAPEEDHSVDHADTGQEGNVQRPVPGSSGTPQVVPPPEPVPELQGPERRYPARLRTPVDRLTY